MITQVRSARPSLILNGTDYYDKLAPYFVTLEYTDNCDGEKADDLSIQLGDRDKHFISDWMPDKGTFLDVSIIAQRWLAPNAPALSLDCGRLWIDSVELEIPANSVTIKGSSIPTSAFLKASDETRGWESTSLQGIAQQVASENSMTLDYQSSTNPRYDRVEQTEESSLAFLMKLARDAKLSIKIHRNAIVIFDEETYEAAAAKFTLWYGNDVPAPAGVPAYRMTGAHFTTSLVDTTKTARLKHARPETGLTTNEDFSADDDISDNLTNNINEDPGYGSDGGEGEGGGDGGARRFGDGPDPTQIDYSLDDGSAAGQRKAKSSVREANKHKWTASIDLALGNPLIAAGMTCNVVGVGNYDGKYFIESAKHVVGPMYNTSLEIRRCLVGY
jgi:hypothetical protein